MIILFEFPINLKQFLPWLDNIKKYILQTNVEAIYPKRYCCNKLTEVRTDKKNCGTTKITSFFDL